MNDAVLEISWPLGEAIGTGCPFGNLMLASRRLLDRWSGLDQPGYLDLMLEKSRSWCSIVQVGDATGCLFGDVPGSFFVGSARLKAATDEPHRSALALLKWVAAPEDYGLPSICNVSRKDLGRSLLSRTWATDEADYYLFCSDEAGEEVLDRGDVP